MDKWVTIEDMYKYLNIHGSGAPLLTASYPTYLTFWDNYVDSFQNYDRYFVGKYRTFRYFYQDVPNDEDIGDIIFRFQENVTAHLIVNDKKYAELYRINVLDDEDYPLFNDVDYTKTLQGSKNSNGSYISGSRSDSNSETVGSQNNTIEQQTSAFDSTTYSPKDKTIESLGQQSNSSGYQKGQQTDTNTNAELTGSTETVKGKMNDKSLSSIVGTHIKIWTPYEFYGYIFKEISKELLLI